MRSGAARRVGAVAVAVIVVIVLVALIGVTRSGDEPQAVATPVFEPTTTTAPAPTTTTEAPTTTTTEAPAAPAAPIPHPGPPVFPTTVASTKPATNLVGIYNAPGGTLVKTIASPLPFSHMAAVFKVLDQGVPGWLHVSLPTRPNGSTGYIKTTDVNLFTNDWSIDVDVAAHWMTVYQGKDVFLDTAVVTGVSHTPTPLGDFFLEEAVWERNPGGYHGPFIFGLSAHSEILMTFDGGDGQIGIHGTNFPQLMGTSASNGCIRVTNDIIVKLAHVLPMGVPVHLH